MKLYSLKMEGFRRHYNTEVIFSDATFLIGENNVGKSSVLAALNYLLNDIKKIPESEFFHIIDDNGNNKRLVDKIILTAEFRDLPVESYEWMGFRGRILPYSVGENTEETGLKIIYRKTFELNNNYIVELREFKRQKKQEFLDCRTLNDYIEAGLDEKNIPAILEDINPEKTLTKAQREKIDQLDELYVFDDSEKTWFNNPGGIPGNVLQRLPKFLLIPAQDKADELSSSSGTLVSTLNELFSDVRERSDNFKEAQRFLGQLAQELDPSDGQSEFGRMMLELNDVLSEVFPRSSINAAMQLSDANQVIKPQFNVSMKSNVETDIALQGTGVIRAAVFALLRYRNLRENKMLEKKGNGTRPLIIGFEEPELYMHPNAAFQMRNTIYELASSDHNQIICTTHSPYMIDLSKNPSQTLCNFTLYKNIVQYESENYEIEEIKSYAFNTSKAFKSLLDNEKHYLKMLLKIDDYMAKVFFTQNVLVVEGDTEEIVLKETINRMPENVKKDVQQNWQIVKARGKAIIISLVKYLKAMGINPVVLHDEDKGVERAEMFNQPIVDALGDASRRIMLSNCIEDVLGYNRPQKDKPYKAYRHINQEWGDNWESVSGPWRAKVEDIFVESFKLQ